MSILFLRNSDSDGLEKFFGCVKSCCQIACTPTLRQFTAGYGTMIFNNLIGAKSLSANCEEDSSVALLNNVDDLIQEFNSKTESNVNETQQNSLFDVVVCDPQFEKRELNFFENESLSYTSNVICAKIVKCMFCKNCECNLQTDSNYPSPDFVKKFEIISDIAMQIIPIFSSEKKLIKIVSEEVKKIYNEKVETNEVEETGVLGCVEHEKEVTEKLYKFTIAHGLDIFCRNVNDLLTGKIKVLPKDPNGIQELAHSFWLKKKRIGKHSDLFKN